MLAARAGPGSPDSAHRTTPGDWANAGAVMLMSPFDCAGMQMLDGPVGRERQLDPRLHSKTSSAIEICH